MLGVQESLQPWRELALTLKNEWNVPEGGERFWFRKLIKGAEPWCEAGR